MIDRTNDCRYWLWGGKYRENKKYCHKMLLKTVKLDPGHAPTFSLLAELLHTVMGDTEKAMKCLVKAVTLDPDDMDSAQALSQYYAADSKHVELQGLCERVLASTGGDGSRVKWAWQRLGVAQQKENDLADSIVSMQRAVRCDQDDATSWQELANSYNLQGKYACATKVLARILAMPNGTKNLSAIHLKGQLHLLLAETDEAVADFEALYAAHPGWAPAALGLGESLLRRACEEYASGWLRLSTETLGRSVGLLQACVASSPQLLAPWKMLGDALHRFSFLAPAECEAAWKVMSATPVAAPAEAQTANVTDADLRAHLAAAVAEASPSDAAKVAKAGLLRAAAVAYAWVACGEPDSPAAWHDLGVSTHERSQLSVHISDAAVAIIAAAIRLDPLNPVIWSSMGSVHPDPRVGQVSQNHEFCIKNEELCSKNEEFRVKIDGFCSTRSSGPFSSTTSRFDSNRRILISYSRILIS